jgi:hypothetical protein
MSIRGFLPQTTGKDIVLPIMDAHRHKQHSIMIGLSFVCEKCKTKKSIKMKGNGNICKNCEGDK